MKRFCTLLAAILLVFSLLVPSGMAAANGSEKSRGKDPRESVREELDLLAKERIPTPEERENVFKKHGFRKLSAGEDFGILSVGSDIAQTLNVYVYGTTATAEFTWNWKDGAWDWANGPDDIVSVNFTDSNGKAVPNIIMSGYQPRMYTYYRSGSRCSHDGWVHDFDNVNKGIIFRYQDYTTPTDMCGDQGWGMFDVENFAGSLRPMLVKLTHHHNWNTAEIDTIALGANVSEKSAITLNVTYRVTGNSWQIAVQKTLY